MMWMKTGGLMNKYLVTLLLVVIGLLFLAGCLDYTALPMVTGSPSPTYGDSNLATATRIAAEATAVALNVDIIHAEGTVQSAAATADVYRGLMTATAQQAAVEATARAQYLASEATAQSAQLTQMAAATGTQHAWMIIGWTATADAALSTQTAVASATAYAWTQQAVDRQATADAASVMALATSQAAQAGIAQEAAEQERIQTERQDFIKYAWAVAPFALGGITLVLIIIALVNWANFKTIQRGADGNLPLIIIGNKRMLAGDRAVHPVTDIQHPVLPPADVQTRITENDQKVQGIRALVAASKPRPAQRMAQGLASQPPAAPPTVLPQITVIDPKTAHPMVEDVVPTIFRTAIVDDSKEVNQ